MISNLVGQQAPGSLDIVFEHSPALSLWLINDYPLLSMLWNLSLLVVPFLAMLALEYYYKRTKKFKHGKNKLLAGLIGLVWLIFIPNTAYIITDVRHLYVADCQMSSYYRVCANEAWTIMVFFTYACVGWVFFVWLVRRMKIFLTKVYSKKVGIYFIAILVPLVSLGVLLGLLERWNSWQIVSSPWLVWQSALGYFTDLTKFTNWLIFTICLYILYYSGEMVFVKKIKKNSK